MVTVVRDPTLALNIAVPDSADVEVIEIPVLGHRRMGVQVKVQNNPLAAFTVQTQFHIAGDWFSLYSTEIDFSQPSGILVGASPGVFPAVPVGSGWFILDTFGLPAIKLLARSAAPTGSVVSIFAGRW